MYAINHRGKSISSIGSSTQMIKSQSRISHEMFHLSWFTYLITVSAISLIEGLFLLLFLLLLMVMWIELQSWEDLLFFPLHPCHLNFSYWIKNRREGISILSLPFLVYDHHLNTFGDGVFQTLHSPLITFMSKKIKNDNSPILKDE